MNTTTIFLQSLIWNIVLWIGIISILLVIRIFKDKLNQKITYITALTVGLLLWIVFLWFIPNLLWKWLNPKTLWIFILTWIIIFYILELIIHNHHCKELQDTSHIYEEHKHSWLMFTWTLIHNMIHWIVLFAAFSSSFEFGVITTIAVLLHSIPQNVANYFLSMKKEKLVFIAALWWVIWSLILFPFKDILLENRWIIISIIAWGLLYIALSDILPEWKHNKNMKNKIQYLIFIIIWITIFIWISQLEVFLRNFK